MDANCVEKRTLTASSLAAVTGAAVEGLRASALLFSVYLYVAVHGRVRFRLFVCASNGSGRCSGATKTLPENTAGSMKYFDCATLLYGGVNGFSKSASFPVFTWQLHV